VEKRSKLHGAENPVLLIQGFGSTRRTLSIMERRLYRDGYPVFSVHLGGVLNTFNSKRIEELAQYIKEKVEAIYKKYQFKGKMSIIGHSKGGLIGRYYVQCLGGHERVRTLITLGTPHNGNLWALIGSFTPIGWIMKSIPQMRPRSPLIQQLQKLPFPKDSTLISIYSPDDSVNPHACAIVDLGPEHANVLNICVDGVGHQDYLIKKSVYSHVKRGLRDSHADSGKAELKPVGRVHPNLRLVKAS
jgi:hypothetical protein